MIKKESIEKTAVCYWSKEDVSYVAESPLFPRTAGIGDTPQEARDHFTNMLNEAYSYLADKKVRGYNKRGRPAKNGINFHTQIRANTKKYIAKLAKEFDISHGEVLDFLCAFHESASMQPQSTKEDLTNTEALKRQLKKAMLALLTQLEPKKRKRSA
jgi:hypothetical protein